MSLSILIVDDEPDFLRAIGKILRAEGHTVWLAPTALEAVDIIDQQVIDLAIIDYELNTLLTGLDVAKHTKLGTERIMITGHHPDEMRPHFEDPLRLFRAIIGKPLLDQGMEYLRKVILRIEKSKEDTAP